MLAEQTKLTELTALVERYKAEAWLILELEAVVDEAPKNERMVLYVEPV